MPICAAITNAMGGIVAGGNGAVLDQSDTPMPGLFAAGSTVGGLDGGPNAGYVGGLIKATIALRAAEAIAAGVNTPLVCGEARIVPPPPQKQTFPNTCVATTHSGQ